MKEYIIEGEYVDTLGDFIAEFLNMGWHNPMQPELVQIPLSREQMQELKLKRRKDPEWESNLEDLNRFNEYIRFLTEDNDEVILTIKNSDRIREVLGYKTTLASAEKALVWSRKQVALGNTEYQPMVDDDILEVEKLKKGETGPMLFDYVTELIQENPKIHLRLE